MVVDAKTWLAECAAALSQAYLAAPRYGTDDVLAEGDALRLAGELIEDRAYRHLEPREAAEAFMRDTA